MLKYACACELPCDCKDEQKLCLCGNEITEYEKEVVGVCRDCR